jgi:hypothetical protein
MLFSGMPDVAVVPCWFCNSRWGNCPTRVPGSIFRWASPVGSCHGLKTGLAVWSAAALTAAVDIGVGRMAVAEGLIVAPLPVSRGVGRLVSGGGVERELVHTCSTLFPSRRYWYAGVGVFVRSSAVSLSVRAASPAGTAAPSMRCAIVSGRSVTDGLPLPVSLGEVPDCSVVKIS